MHDPDLRKNFGSRSTCCEGDLHALRETAGYHQGLVKLPRIFLALPHSTTLAPNEFFQSKRVITPIRTQASPAFCRDKGRMRRWVGALCSILFKYLNLAPISGREPQERSLPKAG